MGQLKRGGRFGDFGSKGKQRKVGEMLTPMGQGQEDKQMKEFE